MPIFADHAHELAKIGLAVIPLAGVDGKRPQVKGFAKWRKPPSPQAILKFAAKFPDANIGVITGLSKIVVVDCDDWADACKIETIFGWTPFRTRTSRGFHFWYRAPDEPVRQISLRTYGLNADLKAGSGYVLVPPSLHKSGVRYALENCDWMALHEIPKFDLEALNRFMRGSQRPNGKFQPNVTLTARPPLVGLRTGSRGLDLNLLLCSQSWACDSFDDLLDCAHTINSNFEDLGLALLDDNEVLTRTAAVWSDLEAGKLERWHSSPAVVRTSAKEVWDLCSRGKHGGDGVALLMVLRAEHQARVHRGETFALDAKAMSAHQSLPWTIERFRNAIRFLLEAGYIELVSSYKNTKQGREAARYTLRARTS